MLKTTNQRKNIIKEGIKEKIDFAELRTKLPDMKKREIVSLVFDVMEESDIKQIPFPGMVVRPRRTRKPIPVEKDGTMNIQDLLKEKGFATQVCEARCHVGKDKITLTVKPIKNRKTETKSYDGDGDNKNSEGGFERMDFTLY